ncbi:MAG: twitching motility protein PilT [Chloroflexi bacterium]|nr:twitching motility protein PilT [Chloroflexota bacterium]
MYQAYFRFYAELNDFLAPPRRRNMFTCNFEVSSSVKEMIEALGVPHTEVDVILVNDKSVDFSYVVQDSDRMRVYPAFESNEITPLIRLKPQPQHQARFVLDTHLGKLAAYLRMLGFDTLYRNNYHDKELATISSEQERILLTRDRGLLKHKAVTRGYYVREIDPGQQLAEILRYFNLAEAIKPFARCLRCNGLLQPIAKEMICHRVSANTGQFYNDFHICLTCDQIYWKGSHYERMQQFIMQVLQKEA